MDPNDDDQSMDDILMSARSETNGMRGVEARGVARR